MTIYEKRTYSVKIGQMPEVIRLYSEAGWPAMDAGGFGKYLVGYFISDTGPIFGALTVTVNAGIFGIVCLPMRSSWRLPYRSGRFWMHRRFSCCIRRHGAPGRSRIVRSGSGSCLQGPGGGSSCSRGHGMENLKKGDASWKMNRLSEKNWWHCSAAAMRI